MPRTPLVIAVVLLGLLLAAPAASAPLADYPFLRTFSNSTGTPWLMGYSYGIAFNGTGYAYICNTGGHHIGAYDPQGDRVAWWTATWPAGIAVNSTGFVFVGDQGLSVFDPNDPPAGYYLDVFTPAGVHVDRVSLPDRVGGVAVNSSDHVFVSVGDEPALRVYSRDGLPAGTIGSGLGEPSLVAVNGTDHLYVLDGAQPGHVSILDRDGLPAGSMTTGFPDVSGLAIDRNDRVYATDSSGNRFCVISPAGTLLGTSSGGDLLVPGAVGVSPSGEVFVSDTRNGRVQVFSGVPVLPVPGGTDTPRDPDGDGLREDVNGNGRADFADVVLYFNRMTWVAANEPVSLFDFNANGRIDFADVVWLFNHL
jgi:PKD repeat protein